ncbi:MAG TPA: sigma-E factor negative regulatory protein [Solimonas sp.]|nr:sigma-E factor negative regulatory protein [Solimonas sp.]
MSEETLSALLDGECSPEELDRLLAEMERSPQLKGAYSRLRMAREAAEGTRVRKGQPCICSGVMAGLDEAPLPVSDKVTDLDSRRPARSGRWKPFAGFAVAASMGAAAVLVAMPQVQQRGSQAAGSFIPQVSSPVSLPIPVVRPRNLQMVSAEAEQEDDLSGYLMEHNSAAASRGMGGTLSYARFAAHNAVYRPQSEEQP